MYFRQNRWLVILIIILIFISCIKGVKVTNEEAVANGKGVIIENNIQNNVRSNYPMNNINISKIILPNNLGGNEIIPLNNDYGDYSFVFDKNTILVSWYNKNVEFDRLFMYQNGYSSDFFTSLDKGIKDNINNFPSWYSYDNIRKRIINNIVLVDSFRFCTDSNYRQLDRSIFISSSNYNIHIRMFVKEEEGKEIYDLILSETPEYFIIDLNTHPNFAIMWKNNNSIVDFGNDLINGNHKSKSATEWYVETEKILNGLQIE